LKLFKITASLLLITLLATVLSSCSVTYPPLARGLNLGNSLEAKPGEDWGLTIKNEYFDIIKSAGFDHVRLPVRFNSYFKDGNLDENFMQTLDGFIDYAISKKLSVILDFHHFDELYSDAEKNENDFYQIWQILSNRYKKYNNYLIFELLNEPRGTVSDEKWNKMLAHTIDIVRQTNRQRKIIVDAGFWSNWEHIENLELPKDDNIIVAFHYYNPQPFTFQGDPYNGYKDTRGVTWGSDDDKEYLNNSFAKVKEWAVKNNRDIILNEFGAAKTVPENLRQDWINSVRQAAENNGFAWTYWEFSTGFGIYDTQDNAWDENILNCLIIKEAGRH
jgi:endoglucanase